MSFSGTLNAIPLIDIVQLIGLARRTGTLTIVTRRGRFAVAFRDGSVVGARPGSLVDASGLSLPVVSDPDGALVVPGITPGGASFRLASSVVWYEAEGHGRSEAGSAR